MNATLKKKLVVLTGAGTSAESGLSTFRDSCGLWEGHNVMDVASPEGWRRNKELVLDFYNQRRRQLAKAEPNDAHTALVKLEERYDVTVVTQNVDNLHEKAGSANVIHLHGELTKAKSSAYPDLIYDIGFIDIKPGDKCERGSQLRPHVVWFGEAVPMMEEAIKHSYLCEIFVVIGTSLVVYPAASLLQFVPDDSEVYIIDPSKPEIYSGGSNVKFIQKKATEGTKELLKLLL